MPGFPSAVDNINNDDDDDDGEDDQIKAEWKHTHISQFMMQTSTSDASVRTFAFY